MRGVSSPDVCCGRSGNGVGEIGSLLSLPCGPLGAYPVVWCLAGEGAMPYYLSTTKERDAAEQKQGWNRRGQPFGPSPHGRSWGDIPWDEAARLPGATHIAHSKALLMRYPWWRFEPHPEWVDPQNARTIREPKQGSNASGRYAAWDGELWLVVSLRASGSPSNT
jgi:hypothetical protein